MTTITLPNGRATTIGKYAAAWAAIKHCRPERLIGLFFHHPAPASQILAEMRKGLMDRINRHLPRTGRNYSDGYWDALRVSQWVNSRTVVRANQFNESPTLSKIAKRISPERITH